MIRAVLLVPTEGDPRGLLEGGPCGAQPPIAQEYADGLRSWWQSGDHDRHAEHWRSRATRAALTYRTGRRALVLAWDGEPVAEGCFRADTTEWYLFVELITSIMAGELRAWSEMPKTNVGALADLVPGTLVLLDAEGQEVSDEAL